MEVGTAGVATDAMEAASASAATCKQAVNNMPMPMNAQESVTNVSACTRMCECVHMHHNIMSRHACVGRVGRACVDVPVYTHMCEHEGTHERAYMSVCMDEYENVHSCKYLHVFALRASAGTRSSSNLAVVAAERYPVSWA